MKKRVISAIVALMIFVPLVIIGGVWFKLAVTILAFLGMKEFLDLPHNKKRPIYVDVSFYAFAMLLTYVSSRREIYYLLSALIPMIMVIYCNDNNKYSADDAFRLIGMVFLIGTIFNKFIILRNDNIYLFIYLFVITMITDTFAHMGGTLIGKHKLAPKISPNKTWEGSITGGFFGMLCASVFYYIFINSNVNILALLIVTLFLSTLGQLGDLFFSCVKRKYKVKDFSNIMPGHGGVLDRLDSIIFVMIGYIIISGII